MTDVSARSSDLKTLITSIEKQHGKGAIMSLGDHRTSQEDRVIPTGSVALDRALGVGGYPRGRIIEIYGPESSGKTTLALHAMREAQRKGGAAAFIDAEHALDVSYAKALASTSACCSSRSRTAASRPSRSARA
jgi:recombination protein RecA